MATVDQIPQDQEPAYAAHWYARPPEAVARDFGVDPAAGLTAGRVAELLSANGPNALPEEKPKPGWLRLLDEYRSYMQIILVGAAIVSVIARRRGAGQPASAFASDEEASLTPSRPLR